MKTSYVVIELQTLASGQVANIVNTYEDERDANSKYHTILAAAAKSGLPAHAAVILTNEGYAQAQQCYVTPEEGED